MSYGVLIEKGPVDWQIIQQTNGSADISLSGKCYSPAETGIYKVYARAVNEATAEPVIRWQECIISNKNRVI